MSLHEKYIKRANRLAMEAAKNGDHPFGSVLVHGDSIIAEAMNTVNTDDDFTRHAELNLVAAAVRDFPLKILQESTLYASTAPCLMCAAAIWRAGIRKVVYGVRYETHAKMVSNDYKYVSIEEAFNLLETELESSGGVLEEECLETYKYWPKS